ncbi:MAG: hypothetical protein IT444_12360 [Phycisphaeraceae bacterium]|nr:hypothetical protein [Phycisphaeraceae bacterium]
MDPRTSKIAGIDYGNWCAIVNTCYLAALIAAACVAINVLWPLAWWQNLIAVVVLFFPLGWFVDHHAHGTLLVNAVFRWRHRAG